MPFYLPRGCLPMAVFLIFLILLPLFLADVMLSALSRLGFSPMESFLAAFGIFAGGLVNIPIKKIPRQEYLDFTPYGFYGFNRILRQRMARKRYTIIAINLGGCVIPSLIVVYELTRIAFYGPEALFFAFSAIAINIFICYKIAQPVPKVGIAMPAFVPPFVAAICGFLFFRELAPLIAFCAGVLGPLVGADLLHLKEIHRINTSMASIGGAGTFDGIVLSGILATLLA